MRRLSRFGSSRLLASVITAAALASPVGLAHAAKAPGVSGKDARKQVAEIRTELGKVVKKAREKKKPSESELAKRLVAGQLKLSDRDPEGAAIIFLDLLENHAGSDAARQALVYLGEALVELDMFKWAGECFGRNLADSNTEAARFHQRSLANLLRLASPARQAGFAQRPGLSATPEVRARLQAIGVETDEAPPKSHMGPSDIQRIIDWVQRIPLDKRQAMLSYEYGRWLYLSGFHDHALRAMDALAPPEEMLRGGGPAGPYRLQATYIASSARLAQGKIDEAVAGFSKITSHRTTDPEEAAIVELSWMALGRVFHDEKDVERSVDAYRKISRDSKYFPEAMYETAWTLLRAGRNEGALQALDLLLVYDPTSPIAPEIKQLRGKIRIQERDWKGAEGEFLALRREFAALGRQVREKLRSQADAQAWFSAVVAEDMEHFTIAAIMPVDAAQLAESLPRAVQGRELARDVGSLAVELDDVRALLAKMETAVRAKERASLFEDLNALMAAADAAELQLVEIQEGILARTLAKAKSPALDKLDQKRAKYRKVVDEYDSGPKSSGERQRKLRRLAEISHNYDLAIAALRAQLIASERYYDETRERQKLDHAAFLKQAADLRDEIAALEAASRQLRDEIDRVGTGMRLDAPHKQRRRKVIGEYSAFLDKFWARAQAAAEDREAKLAWAEAAKLRVQVAGVRRLIDNAALDRLKRAIVILKEERANLDRYQQEMVQMEGATRELVGEVMQATTRDVVAELQNLVVRSEVGLLDVAWAIQEVEAEEIRRLEIERRPRRQGDRRALPTSSGGAEVSFVARRVALALGLGALIAPVAADAAPPADPMGDPTAPAKVQRVQRPGPAPAPAAGLPRWCGDDAPE